MRHRWDALLEQLVTERYGRLLARATLLTGSRSDAEDLVQEALLASFGGRARFDTLAEAEQYVRRAITTRSVDRARTAVRDRALHERLAGRAVQTVEIELPGLTRTVADALGQLAPRERACVVLRHIDDLSVRQTADALGLSEGAVKRYTADGIARLNALLATAGPSVDWVALEAKEVRNRG
jgi:RNA polymerase sigma factor (sigma-70 family)